MPFTTKRKALSLTLDEKQRLESLRRSRTGEKRETLHAGILLDLAGGMSDGAVARSNNVNRHTVALCARKFLQFGLEAALGDLPRPGKSRRIPDDAITWVLQLACQKPKELGYAHELWTCSLLQQHVRKHCAAAGHSSLTELSRSRLHRILTQGEIRPHRIRYYVERRDPEFEPKMAEVLHVYKEVEIVNAGLLEGTLKEPSVVTISYDEKPGIQALATTTPDRPPAVNQFTGHLSADFIVLLGKLDENYPPQTRIRLLLDNHSAHISKETQGWLSLHPHRFEFVFTPKHGSWLNIVETMFSKMARSMLRGIRVASKQELVDRIHLYFQQINADPVIFRWKYKMEETIIV
jgi:transposase